MNNHAIRAGVVGFRGYSGAELVAILNRHPHAEPVPIEHRNETLRADGLDVAFLATPPDASMELAAGLLERCKVIDLSGAFRLGTKENFERWYGEQHTR